jgi:hypothetical protein
MAPQQATRKVHADLLFPKYSIVDTSTGFRTRRAPLKPAEWSEFYWGEMAMDGHFRRLVAGSHVKPATIKAV